MIRPSKIKYKHTSDSTYFFPFVILMTAYELWFKQILYEVDSVREIFMGALKLKPNEEQNMTNGSTESSTEKLTLGKESRVGPKYREVDESRMLEIMNRMNRVVMILKVVQNII